jgi:hypothetical protein
MQVSRVPVVVYVCSSCLIKSPKDIQYFCQGRGKLS